LIFCGIPGSGKTTIARLVATAIGSAVHIQTDTIRSMIPEPAYTWAEARFVYESMFQVGRQALKGGYDVILDGTFLKEDYRAEAEKKLGRYCSSAIVVCITCDAEVARARNSQRSATVPEASFNRLSAIFERPKKAIFVRSDGRTAESAATYILHRLGSARPESDATTTAK
jgi:predicted kinase